MRRAPRGAPGGFNMRHGSKRSIGTIFAVGVLALSLGMAVSSAAGAATPATCTKATFNSNLKTGKATSVLTGCTKGPATGATLVANFKVITKITATVTWNKGGGVSGPFPITEKAVKTGNKCKFETVKGKQVQDALIVSKGTVTKSTGKAASLKGTTFSESLCVTQKSTTYLAPGTKIVI
jgi:hypothetical protein